MKSFQARFDFGCDSVQLFISVHDILCDLPIVSEATRQNILMLLTTSRIRMLPHIGERTIGSGRLALEIYNPDGAMDEHI
jgi:hypothetical protein